MAADPSSRLNAPLIVTVMVIMVVVITLLASLLPGIRDSGDETRSRTRLFRIGRAVRWWVEDHGGRSFPPIVNPMPWQPWEPDRQGSAQMIIGPYLQGDRQQFSPQREQESDAAYLERLRASEMTTCPVTGFEYWYNNDVREVDPRRLALGELPQQRLFHSQTLADGRGPHRQGGRDGIHVLYIDGVQRPVDGPEIAELRAQLERRRARFPDDPDLPGLQAQVERFERAWQHHDDDQEAMIVTRLGEGTVVFEAVP